MLVVCRWMHPVGKVATRAHVGCLSMLARTSTYRLADRNVPREPRRSMSMTMYTANRQLGSFAHMKQSAIAVVRIVVRFFRPVDTSIVRSSRSLRKSLVCSAFSVSLQSLK